MPRKPKASIEPLSAATESAAPAPKKRATPRKATATANTVKSAAPRPKKSAKPASGSEAAPKRAARPNTSSTRSRASRSNGTNVAAVDPSSYHDDIARLAYHFWEQRGRVDGSPEEDWHRAEQEFRRTVRLETA